MRRAGLALALAALAACNAGAPEDEVARDGPDRIRPEAKALVEPVHTPAPAPTTLAGEWRVAGIDGEPFEEPYGLALSADEDAVWWEPRCAGVFIRYQIEGDRFFVATEPIAAPQPVCAVAPPPRMHDVVRAFRYASRIEITPENGVLLSGGEHSVLLFSQ